LDEEKEELRKREIEMEDFSQELEDREISLDIRENYLEKWEKQQKDLEQKHQKEFLDKVEREVEERIKRREAMEA